MKPHNKSLDRWLAYAPWAAAVLVGLCFIALVVRLSTGRSDATVAQQDSASSAATEKPSESTLVTPTRLASALNVSGSASQRQTEGSTEHPRRPGKSGSIHDRPPNAPLSPNSKSRLEIHGGGALIAQPTQPNRAGTAFPIVSVADDLHPQDSQSPSPAPSKSTNTSHRNLVTQFGYRAPSFDGRGYTSFFGVEASGRRFVYVLDRSGSMGEPNNKPLLAAKQELLASLARLDSIHQFFVIFYNEEPAMFNAGGSGRQLVFADELNKRSAQEFIDSIQARGGTKHYEALLKAIALHPDVIFLLTDGEPKDDLTSDELARLKRLNGGIAQIHVVQFADAAYADNSLVRLATENRGQHTYKSIREIVGRTSPP